MRKTSCVAALVVGLMAGGTFAQPVEPSSLYRLSTEGTSARVKPGGPGVFVLAVQTQPGAHVSDEAPLKLELKGTNVTLEKSQLSRPDSVSSKAPGKQFADPRFEVRFTGASAGKGTVDAKLTFFVCTEQLCSRQQKTLSVPVDVQ